MINIFIILLLVILLTSILYLSTKGFVKNIYLKHLVIVVFILFLLDLPSLLNNKSKN